MADAPITITVAYPVAPGDEEDFAVWSRLRLAESAERPGYLGGEVLAPAEPGPDWLIVHRFADERAARRWESWFADSPGGQLAAEVTWTIEEPRSGPIPAMPPPPPPGEPRTQPALSPVPLVPPPSRGRPPPEPPRPAATQQFPRETRAAARERSRDQGWERSRDQGRDLPRDPYRDRPREIEPDEPEPFQEQRSPQLPPVSARWTALVTLVAVFLAAALFDAVLQPLLVGFPALVRTAVLAVVVTTAVTIVTATRVRTRLRNWLVPIAIRERWEDQQDDRDRDRGRDLERDAPPRRQGRRRAAPGRFRSRDQYS